MQFKSCLDVIAALVRIHTICQILTKEAYNVSAFTSVWLSTVSNKSFTKKVHMLSVIYISTCSTLHCMNPQKECWLVKHILTLW